MANGPDRTLKGDGAKSLPQLSESQWNRLGYNLLGRGKTKDAIKVFEHNAALFPQSANMYDSLGEAYLSAGRNAEALENYKKSLSLDPATDNARQFIKKLEILGTSAVHSGGTWIGGVKSPDGKALALSLQFNGDISDLRIWLKTGAQARR